ncbi:hypothetical protein EJB05_54073, partial [Eragrostis curvula]
MAAGSSPTHRPPAKRRKKPSTTTVAALGEDILLEIFLRLPSLATLVRAALTCRGWRRAVASSPAFRRRFRELHPAPLLGLFFETPSVVQTLPAFPSFVPARRRDRDLSAVVRGGDFFLTSIQEHPDLPHSWDIVDCRGGYVLIMNGDQETMAANGSLYCVYKNRKHMVTLDTATWEFSVAELPRCLRNRRCSFVVGETRDGAPCIVYAIDFKVGLLLRGADADGAEGWMLDRVVPLETELGQILGQQMDNYNELKVVAVRDGFGYLATSMFNHGPAPSWFFSLCLKTMKLETLFQRTRDTGVHPYVMTWPSSLVGNRGTFALENGTGNA